MARFNRRKVPKPHYGFAPGFAPGSSGGSHPVGKLTQATSFGAFSMRRYGSFDKDIYTHFVFNPATYAGRAEESSYSAGNEEATYSGGPDEVTYGAAE